MIRWQTDSSGHQRCLRSQPPHPPHPPHHPPTPHRRQARLLRRSPPLARRYHGAPSCPATAGFEGHFKNARQESSSIFSYRRRTEAASLPPLSLSLSLRHPHRHRINGDKAVGRSFVDTVLECLLIIGGAEETSRLRADSGAFPLPRFTRALKKKPKQNAQLALPSSSLKPRTARRERIAFARRRSSTNARSLPVTAAERAREVRRIHKRRNEKAQCMCEDDKGSTATTCERGRDLSQVQRQNRTLPPSVRRRAASRKAGRSAPLFTYGIFRGPLRSLEGHATAILFLGSLLLAGICKQARQGAHYVHVPLPQLVTSHSFPSPVGRQLIRQQ